MRQGFRNKFKTDVVNAAKIINYGYNGMKDIHRETE